MDEEETLVPSKQNVFLKKLSVVFFCPADLVLQFVFNGRSAEQDQIVLNEVGRIRQFLLSILHRSGRSVVRVLPFFVNVVRDLGHCAAQGAQTLTGERFQVIGRHLFTGRKRERKVEK